MKRIIIFFLVSLLYPASFVFADKSEIFVVCVGIADYREISDLRLPVEDAKAVAGLYRTKTDNVVLITEKYATKAQILKSLKEQFCRANENDIIVFSFSGHGFQGGICPYDMSSYVNSGITYDEIKSILKQSRASRKIIFADACFSGGIRGGAAGKNHIQSDTDVLLFLSSRTGEYSIESSQMVNGLFTSYLVRGLRGGADFNKDRKITARELFLFVSKGVKKISKGKQHPVMWGKFNNNLILMDWSIK